MIDISLKAVPNSKSFSISKKGDLVIVHLKNPADKNKANLELIKKFESLFERSVILVSGQKSPKKVLRIDISPERWNCFLSALE
jgi:uncharacterized protein (TIGR00251 family)